MSKASKDDATAKAPKGSRARYLTIDDVKDASDRLTAIAEQITGLVAEMAKAEFDGVLKIDGGDMIADAVQNATAWYYKVQGGFRVRRVADVMTFNSSPPSAAVVEKAEKGRSKAKK